MFSVVGAPLEIEFQEQEEDAQDQGEDQEHDLLIFLLAGLRRMDREGHRQAAADQHGRVAGAELHVEQAAADFKGVQIAASGR